jgi:hypothetical protein
MSAMMRLAAALVVVMSLPCQASAQDGNHSLERISLALQQPPSVLRGADHAEALRAFTLKALGVSIFEPMAGAPKVGPFTLGTPQQGEIIQLSLPIGEYVSRLAHGIAAANHRGKEASARRRVEADLKAFLDRQSPQ